MRRKNISILLAVPAANALSLANFQSITSVLIPLDCQLTYDSQIPSCTVSDFNNGCSTACVAGLNSVASSVSNSCSHVKVNSNTLLGIVKNGGIVAALCPTLAKTTQPATSVTVQTSAPAVQPAAVSVTIPTDSRGVTGGLGFKTSSTSTSISTPIPVPQSEISTSTTKAAKSTKTSTTSQSEQSAAGGLGGGSPATTSHTTTAKKTTSTASSKTTSSPQSQDKSGGGSPFDVQSNDAPRDVGRSMLALVVAVFAVVVIGR